MFHSKLHSIYISFSNGLLTNNSTWCQNRGCICISSVRRTYGRIHKLPVIQTSTIILWTELFPKKRREKIQGEILQSSSSTSTVVFPHSTYKNYKISSNTVFPHAIQQLQVSTVNSTYRINSSPRNTTTTRLIPCHPVQITTRHLPASAPVSPSILHSRIRLPAPHSTSRLPVILPGRNSILSGCQHPRSPYSSSQAESNPLSTTGIHLVLQNSTRRNRILSKGVKYCMSMQY